MRMDSEDDTSDSNVFIAYESSGNSFKSNDDDDALSDDEPITFSLMGKSSKDQVLAKHQKSINVYCPEYIAYAKLVKMEKSQQDELEMLERNLRKPEGLLVEEMEKNQKLIEEQDAFSSTIDDLTNRYDSFTVDYKSLSYELLNGNQELVSLKESHNKPVLEKASLFAEQSTRLPDDFVPPCLKCLERSNADSHAESSKAIIKNIAAVTNDISNPSSKEYDAIADEIAG